MQVLCVMSVNVALHFPDEKKVVPENLRGQKLIADEIKIEEINYHELEVEIQFGGEIYSFHRLRPFVEIEGSSVNVAAILKKLGKSPVIFAPIGNDDFGRKIQERLQAEAIDFIPYRHCGKSAVTAAISDDEGLTTLFCVKPAVEIETERVLHGLREKKLKPLYVAATSVRPGQLAVVSAVLDEFPRAFKAFIPHHELLLGQNQSPTADFLGVVERADILQVNEREANLLHRGAGKDHETFLSSDLEEMLSRFNGIKPSVVIVTLGDKGAATVAFRNGDYEIYSHRPHYVEKVVDTTGSGDCFLAAFIYAQAQGIGHESSVDFASWVAAKNCLGKGGHFAEVDRHSVQGFPWRQPTKSSSEPCLA